MVRKGGVSKVRTIAQNNLLQQMCGDISAQLEWHGQRFDKADWKDILTASWFRTARNQTLRTAPTTDGEGIVVLGLRTSHLDSEDFSELMEFILHFGAEHGVDFTIDEVRYGDGV